jgi:hypothetical protein
MNSKGPGYKNAQIPKSAAYCTLSMAGYAGQLLVKGFMVYP